MLTPDLLTNYTILQNYTILHHIIPYYKITPYYTRYGDKILAELVIYELQNRHRRGHQRV